MAFSNGDVVKNPRFLAHQERRHRIRQRRASSVGADLCVCPYGRTHGFARTGSKNRGKAYQYLAKLDNKIAKQREDWQWKAARKVVEYDPSVFEALNVKNTLQRGVNLSGMRNNSAM